MQRLSSPPRTASVLGFVLVSCGPAGGDAPEGTSDGTGSSTARADDGGPSSQESGSDSSPSVDTTAGNTTGSSSSEGSSTTGEPPSFTCPPRQFEEQCSLVEQDCPDGWHCIPGTSDGLSYDSTVCAPLAAEPVPRYGTCTHDIGTCSDNCEEGTYCWTTQGSGRGTCLGMCDYYAERSTCQSNEACTTCAECVVSTCAPTCDPLAPRCPGEGDQCLLLNEEFFCVSVPAGTAGPGDACDVAWECAPGTTCINQAFLRDSCTAESCCTEFCDVNTGEPACADPAHVCVPYFVPGQAPDGLDHLGVCAVPQADPCLIPGNCPPEGIDDTYPWCSTSNEGFCPDYVLAGFQTECEDGCLCAIECLDKDECPVPLTGTAIPECAPLPLAIKPFVCLLPCPGDTTCPDGMTCSTELAGEQFCTWITTLDGPGCGA